MIVPVLLLMVVSSTLCHSSVILDICCAITMRVDLSPWLGGHTVANQPLTTVLLSFTFILPPGTV